MRDPDDAFAAPRQPDGVTCGATCVAAARARRDTAYARALREDPAATIRAEHRQLARWRDHDGSRRLPWPRALGSSPWSVADALADVEGRTYAVRLLPRDPAQAFREVSALRLDCPAALYVGSRWMPRHVTLVTRTDGQTLEILEPAAGQVLRLRDDRIAADPRIAGWPRWWLLVSPARR